MTHPLMQMLMRWGVLALGVAIATRIIPGIHCDDMAALIVVVLLLSFFNAILKPILVLFTLPFILVTMGLGVVVINALLFLFVGKLVQGFQVDGFWSAVGGAVVVSVTTFIVSRLIGSARRAPTPQPPARRGGKSDDVIDI
ncbi:phage holin family protein [Opitutaceae bacterium EW11]|nr:phage holin family protein [Opitutaceae bacterium EW11]